MSTMEPRTAWLGGRTTDDSWWSWRSLRKYLFGAIAIGVVVVVLVASQSLLAAAIAAVIAGAGWLTSRLARDLGPDSWSTNLGQLARYRVARALGWDRFDPALDAGLPFALGSEPVIWGVAATPDSTQQLALICDRDQLVAVLELDGVGGGIRRTVERNSEGRRMGAMLLALSAAEVPVVQLDIATLIRPAAETPYRQFLAAQDLHPQLETAAEQAVDAVCNHCDDVRSWLVVRMDKSAIAERAVREQGRGDAEATAEAAFDTVGDVAALVSERGMGVRSALTPPMLLALIRSLWLPSYRATDPDGIDTLRDAFAQFAPDLRGEAIRATDPRGLSDPWYHAVGEIPLDGWPGATVPIRWLEPLVARGGANRRLVVTQFALMDRVKARNQALGARTQAEADRIHVRRQGTVTAGDEDVRSSGSLLVVGDIGQRGATGVKVTLRVAVSSPSPRGLTEARRLVQGAAQASMGVMTWRWRDHDHARAFMTVLPFGKGLRS